MTQELGVTRKCSLIIRVTLYAEFLPMKSRATCILLIEVRLTCTTCCISPPTSGCTALRSSVLQIFWALGTVFEVLLAILVMPTLGWRWLLGLSTIPLFIFAILCFVSMLFLFIRLEIFGMKVQLCNCGLATARQWLPESARYDVLTGNQEKALATLKRIATENGAPMPLGKLITARQVRTRFCRTQNNCEATRFFLFCFFAYVLFLLNRRIAERFKTYSHPTFAGRPFCCGSFGEQPSSSLYPRSSSTHVCLCLSPETFSFIICAHVSFRCSSCVFSGLQTPSLTTDWCCSPRSCFRREGHVEVSQCSDTN